MRLRYTPEQEQYLRDNYGKMSRQQIADYLGRSVFAIQNKADKMGLTTNIDWSEEDLKFLHQHYEKMDMAELINRLGRTHKAILTIAHRLGLKRDLSVNNYLSGRSFNGVKRQFREKKKRITSAIIRVAKPKPEVKVKDRVIVPTEPFRVNKKTVLYIPVGTSEEKKQRLFELYNKNKVA